jgi:hypothetical protein
MFATSEPALGSLIATFYITALLFVFIVLGLVARVVGFSIVRFLAYIREELLIVLGASASYIAVPAAMRMAVPKADAGIYVTLSVAITFPFNILIGIPLYLWAAGT